jgi:hypothetical protein
MLPDHPSEFVVTIMDLDGEMPAPVGLEGGDELLEWDLLAVEHDAAIADPTGRGTEAARPAPVLERAVPRGQAFADLDDEVRADPEGMPVEGGVVELAEGEAVDPTTPPQLATSQAADRGFHVPTA